MIAVPLGFKKQVVALLKLLFRENDDIKDNLRILATLYVSGVVWGIIIDFLTRL